MIPVKPEPIILSQNGGPSEGPAPPDSRDDLVGLTVEELERTLLALGEKPYRGRQVAEWIYARGARDFATMTNLPGALRSKLAAHYRIGSLRETARRETPDRKTRKLALHIEDGGIVESVFMSTPKRYTFCL
jgi:23S rRNA (adenine2503-C2)-methyltransferase